MFKSNGSILALAVLLRVGFANMFTETLEAKSTSRRLLAGSKTKYVKLFVYSDYERSQSFREMYDNELGLQHLVKNTEEIVKKAAEYYKATKWHDDIKIEISLVGQSVFHAAKFPFDVQGRQVHGRLGVELGDLLDKFANWAYEKSKITKNSANVNVLLTGAWLMDKNQSGEKNHSSVVGTSKVGAMCNEQSSVNQIRCKRERHMEDCATTFAHELGHLFGFQHDDSSSGDNFLKIMSSSKDFLRSRNHNREFAIRSKNEMRAFIEKKYPSRQCMEESATTELPERTCGNGIVEKGEDCDCGAGGCQGVDSCCEERTCKFKHNFECSDLDGCCDTCKLAKKGTVCRPAANDCKMPARCTGSSKSCPKEVNAFPGMKCKDEVFDGLCSNGACVTSGRVCKEIKTKESNGYRASETCDALNDACDGPMSCKDIYSTKCVHFSSVLIPEGFPCKIDSEDEQRTGLCKDRKCVAHDMFNTSSEAFLCGNGRTDYGEECDCGKEVADTCCNCETCMLKKGKQCFGSDSCCDEKCKFHRNDVVCRPKAGDCDEPELCTGALAICPPDIGKQIGQKCSKNATAGTCYRNKCVGNMDSQCAAADGAHPIALPVGETVTIETNEIMRQKCDSMVCQGHLRSILTRTTGFKDGTKYGEDYYCVDGKEFKPPDEAVPCSEGQLFDAGIGSCTDCHRSCATCRGIGAEYCDSCKDGYTQDSRGRCPPCKAAIQAAKIREGAGGDSKEGYGWFANIVLPILITLVVLTIIAFIVLFCWPKKTDAESERVIRPGGDAESGLTEETSTEKVKMSNSKMPIGDVTELPKGDRPTPTKSKYSKPWRKLEVSDIEEENQKLASRNIRKKNPSGTFL